MRRYFAVLASPRSYANLLYLMIGFPIGLAYFAFYVTAASLGIGLLVLGIGVAVLFATVAMAHGLARFERVVATTLLGVRIRAPRSLPPIEEGVLAWSREVLVHPVTWKGLAFQLARFPFGLASWLLAIVLLALNGAFVFAPLVDALGGTVHVFGWEPHGWETAWFTVAGLLALPGAVHVLNGVAWLWGRLARATLGGEVSRGAVSPPSPHPV